MAASIAGEALAVPAVQHFRRHSPIRSLETWHGRRHQPFLVHGVRRRDAASGLPTGKRIHKPA
jgi:hypothetical protein